jgi:hypothetical protein
MLGKDPQCILEMTRLAVKNPAGRVAVIPGVALTSEEPWKKCQLPPWALSKIVPEFLRFGAGGIAIFSYQSLFSPRYTGLGYLDEVRRLFSKPDVTVR